MPGRKPGLPNDAAARPAERARRHEQQPRVARGVPGINVLLHGPARLALYNRPPENWPIATGCADACCSEFGRLMTHICPVYFWLFSMSDRCLSRGGAD